VLRAMAVGDELAHSSVRFGIGRYTTQADVDYAADKLVEVVARLREMSPLYEMVREGIDLSKVQWTGH
jgi:cysteine desulfurase